MVIQDNLVWERRKSPDTQTCLFPASDNGYFPGREWEERLSLVGMYLIEIHNWVLLHEVTLGMVYWSSNLEVP